MNGNDRRQGSKFDLGNPAKDAFVRQFMRGLKKQKNKEFTQHQATPISLDMLRVIHFHLTHTSGFTEASRLWFLAVSAYAFYGMCRINEVLSLQWKNITLDLARPSASDPTSTIGYGVYKLKGRKTEVAEDNDYVFPALSKIAKSAIKTDDPHTGCENARVEWSKKMSEQSFVALSNCVVRDLNRNETSVPGY
ncbi:hypothetical protein F441_15189, partial [Phytophthora nicotianae CJ01A1]